MNALIIDDNKISRTTLRQLTTLVKDIQVAAECGNVLDAYRFLKENPVDFLLLDIEMPGMTGLELTKSIGANNAVKK